jgi:4'-phosphopantetheinyl transferase
MAFECLWDDPPTEVTLSQDEVHVWCAFLDQPGLRVQSLARSLSKSEQIRAERFHFERDRRRYIVSQGYLRMLLGRYLGIAPEHIEFRYGVRGKPALKRMGDIQSEEELRFNASHSHELGLYAITCNREVGIDIEQIRLVPDAEQIVVRYFAMQEREAFQSLSPDQKVEAFFYCWTRKEAFLKARGEGLYRPLHQFAVSLIPGEPAQLLYFEEDPMELTRWSLQALTPAPGYAAAVAVEGHSWRLSCWRIKE